VLVILVAAKQPTRAAAKPRQLRKPAA